LIEQGCKNIVHVTGDLNRNVYEARCEGYKQMLALHGFPVRDEFIIATDLSIEAGIEVASKIKELSPVPDGVFVANDACAISCMNTLKKYGFRIPEDIAVAGFNNDPYAAFVEPALTTMDYPGEEMGEMVIKSLIEHLENKQDLNSTNRIVLRSTLIIRESTIRNNQSAENTHA
jgi:LacI family transcriptional regulator